MEIIVCSLCNEAHLSCNMHLIIIDCIVPGTSISFLTMASQHKKERARTMFDCILVLLIIYKSDTKLQYWLTECYYYVKKNRRKILWGKHNNMVCPEEGRVHHHFAGPNWLVLLCHCGQATLGQMDFKLDTSIEKEK